jgi:hypothetical protein
MKLLDGNETVLVVTGSSAAARAKDQPIAHWLRDEIDSRGGGLTYRRAIVMVDAEYAGTPGFHNHPTIAVGGPGANDVAERLTQLLPMVWMQGDRSFVQMATHEGGRQAAVWGMDAEATRGAAVAFVREGLLDALLERVWTFRPGALT